VIPKRPTASPTWSADCHEAERDLAANLPSLFNLRKGGPNWYEFYSYKLTELHHWCLTHMPKVILELGSGYTTHVFARYAAEFRAKLVTVEENDKWRENEVMKRLPAWSNVEWHTSQSEVVGGAIHYASLPKLTEIDLLYVDGPASDGKGQVGIGGDDAVRVLELVKPKHVLFDIRHSSVDLFKAATFESYYFYPGGSYECRTPDYLRPRRHHSWFARK
jgi:hypothetical protein